MDGTPVKGPIYHTECIVLISDTLLCHTYDRIYCDVNSRTTPLCYNGKLYIGASYYSTLVRHCFLNIERSVGPLTSVPISPISLRNASVACLCHLFIPMSHVEFKKWPCRMSLYCLDVLSHVNKLNVTCRI